MTSKFTREELLNIIETDHVQCGEASALASMALAAMDSEPVCFVSERNLANLTKHQVSVYVKAEPVMVRPVALYRHAQLAPVSDSKPVAEVVSVFGDSESIGERELKLLVGIQNMPYGTKFYRHAQPAPDTEREPIAWLNDAYLARGVVDGEAGSEDAGPGYIPVYREASPAQPVPVVPDEKPIPNPLNMYAVDAVAAIAEVRGWNACRAAMLNGGKP